MKSDEELIRAFQKGDAASFRTLYTRYKDRAFFYALSLTGSDHAAEEAVQDAFLDFIDKVGTYKTRGTFGNYLFTAIRWRVIDAARKEKLRRKAFQTEKVRLFEKEEEGNRLSWNDELGGLVSRALLALPDGQREAVVLKTYEGMTFQEIARLTGVPENTAASRYRYGCEKLKAQLERIMKDG